MHFLAQSIQKVSHGRNGNEEIVVGGSFAKSGFVDLDIVATGIAGSFDETLD